MKVGDLVKRISSEGRFEAGLVTDIIQKKCWRTGVLGSKVNWDRIEPEPHAVVLIGENYVTIPLTDLQPLDISLT